MGTWGISIFGNDDAADFSFEFDEVDTSEGAVGVLEPALDAVLGYSGSVDGTVAATGLAAAALVVAWDYPEMIGDDAAYTPEVWPLAATPLTRELRVKAGAVFDRLSRSGASEIAEEWADAGQLTEFQDEIKRWRDKLSG